MNAGADVSAEAAAVFAPLRPTLQRVAYRMLGSVADAEDMVQEAFVRWLRTDRDAVREPEAFLRRMVTRLCLDQLKSARRRRELYVGPWLPEPVVAPEAERDMDEDVTLPLLMALDRLSPLERAAFLLHDVFGLSFDEVAATLEREPAACRQLATRARTHVRADRPRFPVAKERGLEIARAFFQASRSGDMGALRSMLADDVAIFSDGGGKRAAAARPYYGINEAVTVFATLARLLRQGRYELVGYRMINGLPGFVTREADGMLQTTALLIENDRIAGVYVVRNPDKLRHLEPGPEEA
ncbi:sigma-70 family RNA polymerase sigma factor [Sphingosinicella sp. LHD-64]|uniref:sigma-70 family RNA polymerase sigma factor n=1 Tax=Sphingosinicella sp. LHD-64 TaxID=3072139 RepID=UPI00280CB446|nr:sigma-70 family RNA polymerase sigma factor [Sphingosinicella sp. LHD-64]MDQ8755156.1 sigma-70 family RNA polymerase sigma factor [Sphingosinicella sp. LHD-64]